MSLIVEGDIIGPTTQEVMLPLPARLGSLTTSADVDVHDIVSKLLSQLIHPTTQAPVNVLPTSIEPYVYDELRCHYVPLKETSQLHEGARLRFVHGLVTSQIVRRSRSQRYPAPERRPDQHPSLPFLTSPKRSKRSGRTIVGTEVDSYSMEASPIALSVTACSTPDTVSDVGDEVDVVEPPLREVPSGMVAGTNPLGLHLRRQGANLRPIVGDVDSTFTCLSDSSTSESLAFSDEDSPLHKAGSQLGYSAAVSSDTEEELVFSDAESESLGSPAPLQPATAKKTKDVTHVVATSPPTAEYRAPSTPRTIRRLLGIEPSEDSVEVSEERKDSITSSVETQPDKLLCPLGAKAAHPSLVQRTFHALVRIIAITSLAALNIREGTLPLAN